MVKNPSERLGAELKRAVMSEISKDRTVKLSFEGLELYIRTGCIPPQQNPYYTMYDDDLGEYRPLKDDEEWKGGDNNE